MKLRIIPCHDAITCPKLTESTSGKRSQETDVSNSAALVMFGVKGLFPHEHLEIIASQMEVSRRSVDVCPVFSDIKQS